MEVDQVAQAEAHLKAVVVVLPVAEVLQLAVENPQQVEVVLPLQEVVLLLLEEVLLLLEEVLLLLKEVHPHHSRLQLALKRLKRPSMRSLCNQALLSNKLISNNKSNNNNKNK
jgi:hypothetical protein